MPKAWNQRTLSLRYMLGELPLFKVGFPFLVFDGHFAEMDTDLSKPQVPWEALEGPLQGLLVHSHPVEADLPHLTYLPEAIRYVPWQYQHYFVEFRSTFEDYLKKFSSKSRYNLKRDLRKFAERCGGQLQWREYRTAEEMDAFYRQALDLSTKTYQERLLQVGLPRSDEYGRDLKERASRGEARGYLLFDGEKTVAYLLVKARGEILMLDYLGYDPEYRQWSPGSVLQYCVLERLFQERAFRMLDFGQGEGHHKAFYSTGSVRCADIFYFRRTWRNCLLVRLHAAMNAFSAWVGRALAALNLKKAVKRLLRRK